MKAVEHWPTTRWGKVVAALLCIVLAVWLGGRMHAKMRKSAKEGSDYEGFLSGARALLTGGDVVTARAGTPEERGRPFWYLPWFAMFMVPFVLMGREASSFAWPLLNLTALGASSYWCLKAARGPRASVPWPVCVVPPVLVARALDSNFGLAQLNALVLVLVSLGLYLYVRKRDVAAGLAVGAATALKVTPGLLVAYFAWKRQWRGVVSAIGAVVLLAVVVPIPVYGFQGSADSAARWLHTHVLEGRTGAEARSDDGYVPGQSLRALAHRFLTQSQASSLTDAQTRVNLVSLSPGTAESAYKGAAALLIVLLAIVTFGPAARQDSARTGAEVSLVLVTMLLVSPYSRKAHFVLLMLPMTFAYSHLALAETWSRRESVLLAGLIPAFLLTACTARGLIGATASLYLTALGCMGWGTLILLAALLVPLRLARTSRIASQTPASGRPAH